MSVPTYYESTRRRREREKGEERIFEEIMAEYVTNLRENVTVHIQEIQWTPHM